MEKSMEISITLLLSIYATLISTILGIISVLGYFKNQKKAFKLTCTCFKPYDKINVCIVNTGQRPITIEAYKVSIGFDATFNKVLFKKNLETKEKLEEAKPFQFDILREHIVNFIKEKEISQRYFQRLFVEIILSTNQKKISPVYIDLNIIDKSDLDFDSTIEAEPYIATDIFVGFKPMKPRFRRKKVMIVN